MSDLPISERQQFWLDRKLPRQWASREVLIPKPGQAGQTRSLGISNLEDKIVQGMMHSCRSVADTSPRSVAAAACMLGTTCARSGSPARTRRGNE